MDIRRRRLPRRVRDQLPTPERMPDSPTPETPAPDRAHANGPVPASGFACVTGRWSRWIVVSAWLAAFAAVNLADLQGKLADATENEAASFVPKEAESTKATAAIE